MASQIKVLSAQPSQGHVGPSAPPKEANAGSLLGRNVDQVRSAVSEGYKRSALYYLKVAAIIISTAAMIFAVNMKITTCLSRDLKRLTLLKHLLICGEIF